MTHSDVRMSRVLGFFFILFFLAQTADAQKVLVLTKRKNGKAKLFFLGDKVSFRFKGGDKIERGRISLLEDNGFQVNGHRVVLDSLGFISEGRRGLRTALGVASMGVGAFLLFGGVFESLPVFLLGSAFFGTGLIQASIYGIRMIAHDRYDLTKKWRIEVRELDNWTDTPPGR